LGNASELLNYSVVKHLPKRQAFFRTLLLPTTLAVIAYTLPHGAGLYHGLNQPGVAKKGLARASAVLRSGASQRSSLDTYLLDSELHELLLEWNDAPHDFDRAGRSAPSQQTLNFSDSYCSMLRADIGPDICGSGTSWASLKSTRHRTWDFRAASGHA
jgi:hypothetical protein